jgi:hypothetical protein
MDSLNEIDANSKESVDAEQVSTLAIASTIAPKKTPMYEAIHALRYHRQELIKQIGEAYGSRLICYVCGRGAEIHRDDAAGFVEMLHNIPPDTNIDLLLHTGGGDIDAAEKLIALVQATVGKARLRVIIPDFAKSAGTIMALAADTLIMSDSSELGAIDPQIWLKDGHGNWICHSVLSYLDAYKTHSEALRNNPNDPVALLMLSRLDPATVRQFELIKARARGVAEEILKKKGRNYTKIPDALMDLNRWPSHGQMISWKDAKQEPLELDVEYLPPTNEQWRAYWRLYCLLRLAINDKDKQNIFESSYASLILEQ